MNLKSEKIISQAEGKEKTQLEKTDASYSSG